MASYTRLRMSVVHGSVAERRQTVPFGVTSVARSRPSRAPELTARNVGNPERTWNDGDDEGVGRTSAARGSGAPNPEVAPPLAVRTPLFLS